MPQWKNKHQKSCPVTGARADLWRELYKDPTAPELLGALPSYDLGGDQERELCTCGFFAPPTHAEAYLMWQQTRSVALSLRALAVRIETAQGSTQWKEVLPGDRSKNLMTLRMNSFILCKWADRLDALADLWDRG